MVEICGIIPPRIRDAIGFRDDGYLPECIRPFHNTAPHVFKTPEDKYFAWEDDWSCDCCEPMEDDRCYTISEISETEARRFMEGQE